MRPIHPHQIALKSPPLFPNENDEHVNMQQRNVLGSAPSINSYIQADWRQKQINYALFIWKLIYESTSFCSRIGRIIAEPTFCNIYIMLYSLFILLSFLSYIKFSGPVDAVWGSRQSSKFWLTDNTYVAIALTYSIAIIIDRWECAINSQTTDNTKPNNT